MSGRNSEFPVKINKIAIKQITNRLVNAPVDVPFKDAAEYTTALVLLTLQEYLLERNVRPDFELVFFE